jgi:hypothetical protein
MGNYGTNFLLENWRLPKIPAEMVLTLRWKYLPKDENLTNFSVPRQGKSRDEWLVGVGGCNPYPPRKI